MNTRWLVVAAEVDIVERKWKQEIARVEMLRRKLATAIEALRIANDSADDQMYQKREAQAQRDIAKNWSLEQAAKICDEYAAAGFEGARLCASKIRAMKEFGAHMKEMHEFIAENRRLIKLSENITQHIITKEKP